MEHREPPRIGRSEGPDGDATGPSGARRFARLVPAPHARRLAFSRIAFALVAVGLFLFAGSHLVRFLKSWVDRRPGYQLDSGRVTLDPPPPRWFRGGKDGFLRRLELDPATSVLGLELDRLKVRLTQDCWVKRVGTIRRAYPNRLEIPLEYRTPVLKVQVQGTDFGVDADGVVLPMADVDLKEFGPMRTLTGLDAPPPEGNLGTVWKSKDTKSGIAGEEEPRVLAAARLAAFLMSTAVKTKALPAPYRLSSEIFVSPEAAHKDAADKYDNLWLQLEAGPKSTNPKLWLHWSKIPARDVDRSVPNEEKWERLVDWVGLHPSAPDPLKYHLHFTLSGIELEESKYSHTSPRRH